MDRSRWLHQDKTAETHQAAERLTPITLQAFGLQTMIKLWGSNSYWLHALQRHEVGRMFRLDHSEVAPYPEVERHRFHSLDASFELGSKGSFVIALCGKSEFAKHLPKSQVKPLVKQLKPPLDIVVFSPRIPNKGEEVHITEKPP